MYDRITRVAGPAAILGGLIWLFLPILATHAPNLLLIGVVGVGFIAVGAAGVHLAYRELRNGFYEEIGFGVLYLGLFATIVSVVTYAPANTDSILGIVLSSVPIVAAVILLSVGSALLGVATTVSRALPLWSTLPLVIGMMIDPILYYLQLSTFGSGVSVYGLLWCILGIALLHKQRTTQP